MKRICILTVLLLACGLAGHAQLSIRNGVSIPTRDTLNVLIVFAEVDFSDGPCYKGLKEDFKGNWPKDVRGHTLPPTFADAFFDTALLAEAQPKGFITQFYHEASFGKYVLLGDYLPEVVTVPCSSMRTGNNGVGQILGILGKKDPEETSLRTHAGYTLSHFDQWTNTGRGKPKLKQPDGRIDLLYIIWRNNRMLTSANTRDNAGYGVAVNRGKAFKDMDGLNNMASFNASTSETGAAFITIAEHLHGIFGGNNWHSAGGRGMHTFLMQPGSYGITGQWGATMQSASGWDRWMMEWKPDRKQFVTSALNLQRKEVNTELISIDNNPEGATFILRDFILSGDAVRIKLPHIDWSAPGDVKNQYLWIENRQMDTPTDKWYTEGCADSRDGDFPNGTPGIYCYIQVGKDQRYGGNELYSGSAKNRNALASPFFPVTAEGNYDFRFRYDMIQEADPSIGCNWGNRNIPKDVRHSLPNPFTGLSDLFCTIDYNRDGKLYSGDGISTGMSKLVGDSVVHDYNQSGDWKDAFSAAYGRTELCMSTNPAPVPVYTYATNFEFKRYAAHNGKASGYENRKIWLNGLHLSFKELGAGEIQVNLVWDDYTVNSNVRWCGDIMLSPNDFRPGEPSLILKKKRRMMIDRGESPTFHEAVGKDPDGNWLFADTTRFTMLSGSVMELSPRSRLIINADSRFIISSGAKLILGKRSKVIVRKGAELVRMEGAIVEKNAHSRITIKK